MRGGLAASTSYRSKLRVVCSSLTARRLVAFGTMRWVLLKRVFKEWESPFWYQQDAQDPTPDSGSQTRAMLCLQKNFLLREDKLDRPSISWQLTHHNSRHHDSSWEERLCLHDAQTSSCPAYLDIGEFHKNMNVKLMVLPKKRTVCLFIMWPEDSSFWNHKTHHLIFFGESFFTSLPSECMWRNWENSSSC